MHQGTFSISGVSLTLDILDTSGAYEVTIFDVFSFPALVLSIFL